MRFSSLTSLFFVTLSFVSTSIQVSANLYDLCYTGYYCNGNTDGVRGVITTPDDCYQACLTLGTTTGKSYKFFDLTTNGQSECWCGETCTSKLPYDTHGYSMDGGVCLTDQPTEAPSSSPTTYQPSLRSQSPSNLPTSSQPSLMPSSSPTEIWSLCSSGLYCNGDTVAQRGIFTTAQQCYDQCNNLNQGYQFFDLTEGQGQCWCGTSCDSFLTFPTNGYRMNTGVCPPGNHMVSTSPTQHPTSSVLSEAQILQTGELEISSSTPGFPTPVINYSLPVKYSCSIDIKFPLKGKDWRNIFGQNADTVHYPGLYISVDNNMYIFHDGPSGIQFYGTQFYATLGQYFNLLWTVETGMMKVYVNGQYDGQLTAAFTWGGGPSLTWQWNVYLVSHYNVGYNGLVYVKNLRWWNRALTASEVTSLN